MKNVKQRRFESQGQALIGLLVVIAIILIVMAAMNGGGGHKTIYGNAIQRADVTVCGAYTSQIRDAIVMYRQDYNQNPPNLEALSKYGVRPEMYNSPGCVYSYDPGTGEVSAPDTRPGAAGRAAMGDGQGRWRRHQYSSYQGAGQPQASPDQSGSDQTGGPPPAAQDDSGGGQAPGPSPSTTVMGPGGMPIRVPTGSGY